MKTETVILKQSSPYIRAASERCNENECHAAGKLQGSAQSGHRASANEEIFHASSRTAKPGRNNCTHDEPELRDALRLLTREI